MIDIYSKAEYPACELSNFAEHPFWLDGVEIQSMEGFLQSLKYMRLSKQREICKMSGQEAKKHGKRKIGWRMAMMVFWKEDDFDLLSDKYQILIDRAYDAMYEQSPAFRQALLDTGEEPLAHTIGKTYIGTTILTEYQFVKRLERLRERAWREKLAESETLDRNE